MCCYFLFIHLFLLADNANILNHIYTSLQSLHDKVDAIQTTVTQLGKAATFPLQFQTVQPTTEPLHYAGPIYQPLPQTNMTPRLHQTNMVPCLQTNSTPPFQTDQTPQLQTNSTPPFQTDQTPQFQTNPTPQLQTNPTSPLVLTSLTDKDMQNFLSELPELPEVSQVAECSFHSHQAETPQPLPARTPELLPLEEVMRRDMQNFLSELPELPEVSPVAKCSFHSHQAETPQPLPARTPELLPLEEVMRRDMQNFLSELPELPEVSPVAECSFHSHQAETPQPLPARTPELSPFEEVMCRFPRSESVNTLKTLTRELALHCVFGEDVMATSTISGRNNTSQFDQNKLNHIKTLVQNKAMMSTSNFESAWSKCIESLKKKCQVLKKKKRLQRHSSCKTRPI